MVVPDCSVSPKCARPAVCPVPLRLSDAKMAPMISRSIFHVAGPAGGGKTSFIEAVLAMDAAMINCMRAELDPRSKGYRESRSPRDVELRRYRKAGASDTVRLRFDEEHGDAFYMTDLMNTYSEAVFIEGDMPTEFADLEVFVAPPPADGKGLIRRSRRADPDELADQDRRYALKSPVGLRRLLREKLGDDLVAALYAGPHPVRTSFHEMPSAWRPSKAVAIPRGYEAVENAGLCVVTIHDAASRKAAVRFAKEVQTMRADHELRRKLFGPFSRFVPATIVAADLRDPRDAGTKKALARVRRALRVSR